MLTISIFPISFLSFSGKDVPRDGKLSCVDANDNGKIFCQWKIDHVIVTWCHLSYIIFLANYHVFKWYFDLAFCESCVFVCLSLSLPNNHLIHLAYISFFLVRGFYPHRCGTHMLRWCMTKIHSIFCHDSIGLTWYET